MNLIITYLLTGVLVSFLIDLLQDRLVRIGYLDPKIQESWGWIERCICIAIWPYGIYVFINAFLNNNNKDD